MVDGGGVVALAAAGVPLGVDGCAIAPLAAGKVPLDVGGAEFFCCGAGWFAALACGRADVCAGGGLDAAPALEVAGAEVAACGCEGALCGETAFGAAGDDDVGAAAFLADVDDGADVLGDEDVGAVAFCGAELVPLVPLGCVSD
jgi:hypothetical protein